MEQPLFLVRNVSDADWHRLYEFFVQAEEGQEIVTSVTIQQIFPRTVTGNVQELYTIRWYMYHYWRWFLFCVDDSVRPYEYRCRRLKGYPLEYFLRAHMRPSHMQYFAHFARSIEIDKALRKAAQGQGTPRGPRREKIQVHLPVGRNDLSESQLEEESFEDIPVDDHMDEEEDALQALSALVVSLGPEEHVLTGIKGGASGDVENVVLAAAASNFSLQAPVAAHETLKRSTSSDATQTPVPGTQQVPLHPLLLSFLVYYLIAVICVMLDYLLSPLWFSGD